MTEVVEIFVALVDEGVNVWRPVYARHVEGAVYRIEEQPYDRELEEWQFEPGQERRQSSSGADPQTA